MVWKKNFKKFSTRSSIETFKCFFHLVPKKNYKAACTATQICNNNVGLSCSSGTCNCADGYFFDNKLCGKKRRISFYTFFINQFNKQSLFTS